MNISIGADNFMSVIDERGDVIAQTTDAYQVTVAQLENPCVIAVMATDHGGERFLVANTSSGHVTDTTWKCSGDYEHYWYKFVFDDSHWSDAVIR